MRSRHTLLWLGGDIDATGDLDSVNAITTFFGTDGVFTARRNGRATPRRATAPGYAALSALPVFIGSDGPVDDGEYRRAGRL